MTNEAEIENNEAKRVTATMPNDDYRRLVEKFDENFQNVAALMGVTEPYARKMYHSARITATYENLARVYLQKERYKRALNQIALTLEMTEIP